MKNKMKTKLLALDYNIDQGFPNFVYNAPLKKLEKQ